MPQNYLLPCPACQRKLTVAPTQAGERLACPCGSEVTAPPFREIRTLEPAEAEPSTAEATRRPWSRQQGVMFSLGILVLLAALVLGYFPLAARLQMPAATRPTLDMTSIHAAVDKLAPAETLVLWDEILERGIDRIEAPTHILVRETSQRLNLLIAVAAIFALAGLGSTIAAFFVRPQPRR